MRTRWRRLGATLLVLGLTTLLLPPSGASGDGPGETIGVSGHWIIEVRDPEGRPVERREFHNALDPDNRIPQVLMGSSAGPLEISIVCVNGTCSFRIVRPSALVNASPTVFKNLTVTTVPMGFQLKGFAVVNADSQIDRVATRMKICQGTTAPANCTETTSGSTSNLTLATLSQPISVVAGQQVLVTVTIGFSTAAAPQ